MIPVIGALVTQPTLTLAACEAKSGPVTTTLLELYTSEGCNSCPPADRWLSELRQRGFDTARTVPLALHVDYWNNLGWVDLFSQRAFTERQQEFARLTGAQTVYTPEFFLNGREYRRWQSKNLDAEIERIRRTPPGADISLRLTSNDKTLIIDASASLKQKRANAGLYIALYENNLSTQVRTGENAGHTLNHNYVVRRLIGPFKLKSSDATRVSQTVALDKKWKSADLGVAAFVQDTTDASILQALALNSCR